MSIERFFLEGYRDEESYEKLKASNVFPLVREIEFKYGLKVTRMTKINDRKHNFFAESDAWLMSYKNGIAVGMAYTIVNNDSKEEFCWRTPYYTKERGENRDDKNTIRSVKISALMATLSRQKVIPSMNSMEEMKLKPINNAMEVLRKSFGRSDKSAYEFEANEVHALLLMALGKSPNSEWVKVEQNKCQEVLDKFEEADRVAKEKVKESERFFRNPFYLIGVDEFGDYLIGKFKLCEGTEGVRHYETIESFKRYKSYEEVTDLIPVMTMMKLAYENKVNRFFGALPYVSQYDADLDVVFFNRGHPCSYDHTYMATPCPI